MLFIRVMPVGKQFIILLQTYKVFSSPPNFLPVFFVSSQNMMYCRGMKNIFLQKLFG
jgi:hypothetical protein